VTTHLTDTSAPIARVSQHEPCTDVSRDTRSPHEIRREQRPSTNVDQVLDDSFSASDPPSWSGAISRVSRSLERFYSNEGLVRRVRAEFLEMPGLCLTIEQAQRLWSLDAETCERLLNSLINSRFLHRTDHGLFVLRKPEVRDSAR
jgi:hypothetical protein